MHYLYSGGWTIAGNPLDLHDPRLLAVAGTEHHVLEADYDEYVDSSASGAAFCRSATLIVTYTFPTSLIFASSIVLAVYLWYLLFHGYFGIQSLNTLILKL